MKTLSPKFLFLVLLTLVLFSCSKQDDSTYFEKEEPSPELPNTKSYSSMETQIIQLINTHRISLNLHALSPLDIITNESSKHTDYMIENGEISHYNFKKRADKLIKNAKATFVGENVAYGYSTAKGVVSGWLNSEAHRFTIENPKYTNIGISIKKNKKDRNFFTNIFIQKK